MSALDPNTGRPIGDHGSADEAIRFLLDSPQAPGEEREFLTAWREGAAWEEWPEFYDWLIENSPWVGAAA